MAKPVFGLLSHGSVNQKKNNSLMKKIGKTLCFQELHLTELNLVG